MFRKRPPGKPLPPRKHYLNAYYAQLFSPSFRNYLFLQPNNLTVRETVQLRQGLGQHGYAMRVLRVGVASHVLTSTSVHADACKLLRGPTCVVFPTDAEEQRVLEPLKLKKVLVELARQKKMLLLAGRLEGRLFTESTVRAKALLPGLDHLRGELLGLMQMPAQRLASLLQRTSGEEVVRVLDRMHK